MVVDRRYMVQEWPGMYPANYSTVHIKLVAYRLPVFENMHGVCSLDNVVVTHKNKAKLLQVQHVGV